MQDPDSSLAISSPVGDGSIATGGQDSLVQGLGITPRTQPRDQGSGTSLSTDGRNPKGGFEASEDEVSAKDEGEQLVAKGDS